MKRKNGIRAPLALSSHFLTEFGRPWLTQLGLEAILGLKPRKQPLLILRIASEHMPGTHATKNKASAQHFSRPSVYCHTFRTIEAYHYYYEGHPRWGARKPKVPINDS